MAQLTPLQLRLSAKSLALLEQLPAVNPVLKYFALWYENFLESMERPLSPNDW
jgi:hypothetical protein